MKQFYAFYGISLTYLEIYSQNLAKITNPSFTYPLRLLDRLQRPIP